MKATKKMKKKGKKVIEFMEGLHHYVINDPQFRRNTRNKAERDIQTELRPVIIQYLCQYFREQGYKDYVHKANKSFYWEGQEGEYSKEKHSMFGAKSYPDFIITAPYVIAIEYKQAPTGSTVKQGIGQSIVHTLSGDFDYVYYLYHDQSKDKRTEKSVSSPKEQMIISEMWEEYNVFIKFV